jgi:NADPH:quinone reductase
MRAAWYERQGRVREVLVVGEMETPAPGPGEVRVRVYASGLNPGDGKKRADAFGLGMAYPRVIPHSDGAGVIDADRICAITRFDNGVLPQFQLPRTMPA